MTRPIGRITAPDLLTRVGEARVDGVRLLGIDGFSGAGKTTLAHELRTAEPSASLISIETFYLGWHGLAAGPPRARAQLVDPLDRGEVPVIEPWDWRHDRVAPPRHRPVGSLVILEGCGAGARVLRDAYALLVWVDADPTERDRRLRRRDDWTDYAPHRADFERQEQALASTEGTRDAADLVVTLAPDGTWAALSPSAPPQS